MKWTEYKACSDPDAYFIVCLVALENKKALQTVADKFNQLFGPPALASLHDPHTLRLRWRDRDMAYPLMDLALREGFTIYTQTLLPLVVRPSDVWSVLTPENLEFLHIQAIQVHVYGWAKGAALPWITTLQPVFYTMESAWLTEEGKRMARAIKESMVQPPVLFYPEQHDGVVLVVDDDDEKHQEEEESSSSSAHTVDIDDDLPIVIDDDVSQIPQAPLLLDTDTVCAICLCAKVQGLNLPCMCMVFCRACAKNRDPSKPCPYCRKEIECVLIDDG